MDDAARRATLNWQDPQSYHDTGTAPLARGSHRTMGLSEGCHERTQTVRAGLSASAVLSGKLSLACSSGLALVCCKMASG